MNTPIAVDTYCVRMSPEGRLRLPADWRPLFITAENASLMLAPRAGTHLAMMPLARIRTELNTLKALARRAPADERPGMVSIADVQSFLDAVTEVRIGTGGRFTIPRPLRESIGLTRDVVLAGCLDHAELWPPEKWREVDTRPWPDL